jgi:hypothetical protein
VGRDVSRQDGLPQDSLPQDRYGKDAYSIRVQAVTFSALLGFSVTQLGCLFRTDNSSGVVPRSVKYGLATAGPQLCGLSISPMSR